MSRFVALTLAVAAWLAPVSAAAQKPDPLAEARLLYNQRKFDAAIEAAERAHLAASVPDSADLIAARAYLERYRDSASPEDLGAARDRLRRLDPQNFTTQERVELIVGLGETLYFDQSYGAAAEVFQLALDASAGIAGESRERVLDWWASASDRETRPRAEADRQALYERLRSRMHSELVAHPGSAAASYWLAAAARSKGDLEAAWNAAEAGWVRAMLSPDGGVVLRSDLERLMQQGIIPERAKATSQPADNMRAEWERFKEKWKKN